MNLNHCFAFQVIQPWLLQLLSRQLYGNLFSQHDDYCDLYIIDPSILLLLLGVKRNRTLLQSWADDDNYGDDYGDDDSDNGGDDDGDDDIMIIMINMMIMMIMMIIITVDIRRVG